MAKEGLGSKRICPETGKKFYDLGKDPVVSPYTGKSYPLSFFLEGHHPVKVKKEQARPIDEDEEDLETEDEAEDEDEAGDESVELVSLEDVEEEEEEDDGDIETSDDAEEEDEIPDLPDVEIEDEDEAEEDDLFLEDDEEDDDISAVVATPGEDEA